MLPKKLARTKIYESDWINLYTDKVQMPSGKIIEKYHFLDYPTSAAIVILVNDKKEICFVKSLRYVTQKIEWELPAGGIDKGETIIESAAREVREETGYTAKNLQVEYAYNPSNGMSNQVVYVVTAKLDKQEQQAFDLDEVAEVHWLSIEEIKALIKSKELTDGVSLTSILYYFAFC